MFEGGETRTQDKRGWAIEPLSNPLENALHSLHSRGCQLSIDPDSRWSITSHLLLFFDWPCVLQALVGLPIDMGTLIVIPKEKFLRPGRSNPARGLE
jgi:hypothetical protein